MLASSMPVHGEVSSIQHYVVKIVSYMRQDGVFFRVLLFFLLSKTDPWFNWNNVESGTSFRGLSPAQQSVPRNWRGLLHIFIFEIYSSKIILADLAILCRPFPIFVCIYSTFNYYRRLSFEIIKTNTRVERYYY